MEKPLGQAIKEVLRNYGLEEKLTETQIFSSWEKIMGTPISAYTERLYLKNGCLTVYLRSSALRNELGFAKSKIIKMINDEIKKPVIKEIIFK
jgi:predicted nucleic acid-binding Zn ribbon protein